jgi:hypothetical protein
VIALDIRLFALFALNSLPYSLPGAAREPQPSFIPETTGSFQESFFFRSDGPY